jgi:hypothetical protein
MTKQERQIYLLDQIIEEVERQDVAWKRQMMANHKANRTIGESWTLFHLKSLRELILSPD